MFVHYFTFGDPDNSEESSSTRNWQVNGERGFLWFGVYGKTRRRDQTKLKKELKEQKYAQAQKDIQLLETQIIQKKALERADDELMTSKGIYDMEYMGNLEEEIRQLEEKYAQAQKELQENAATSKSTTEKIVSIVDA